ncbi:Aste57867_11127 [Aphanomyces stellatus]|uniref:Aste57867_11127 protein n=1 Tax=Aphanomyces stellatus TaxID=120398 RepID=A0A485KTB4_9STRA|nr:hypothetical protein As57867_011085 [Aphanomyces stellatus]VFT87994.1 Aste57867_11127 [Aphanomyces stellatus]
MKRRGLLVPVDYAASQFMASFDHVLATRREQPNAQLSSPTTTDDHMLWGHIQATIEHLQVTGFGATQPRTSRRPAEDTTTESADETRVAETTTRPAIDRTTKVIPFNATQEATLVTRLQPLDVPRVATLGAPEDAIEAVTPARNQTMLEQLFGKKKKSSKKNKHKQEEQPAKLAKIMVGGLTDDNISLIARYIHLLGFGEVICATSSDEAVALCRPRDGCPSLFDLVLFVVGRDLERAVPILETLKAFVGPRVILVGGDPDEELKTYAIAYQCVDQGAVYFATIPIVFEELRVQMHRILTRDSTNFILGRKKDKPTSMFAKAISRRRSADEAHSNDSTTSSITTRSWFEPAGALPPLQTAEPNLEDAKSMSWPPPPVASSAAAPSTVTAVVGAVEGSFKPSQPRQASPQFKPPSPRSRYTTDPHKSRRHSQQSTADFDRHTLRAQQRVQATHGKGRPII